MEADIVGIIVDVTTSTVYCLLLGSYIDTPDAVCSITYGYPQGNCERYTDSSVTTTGQPGVNLTIPLSQDVNTGAEFCYTVSLKYSVTTIKIIGNFTSGTCIIAKVFTTYKCLMYMLFTMYQCLMLL